MGIYTSPEQVDYWNETFYLVLAHRFGLCARYAEMDCSALENDDFVEQGQFIGRVGQVLNPGRIGESAPDYVKQLVRDRHSSMLHLEFYACYPREICSYLGGNSFHNVRPDFLLNPEVLLKDANLN